MTIVLNPYAAGYINDEFDRMYTNTDDEQDYSSFSLAGISDLKNELKDLFLTPAALSALRDQLIIVRDRALINPATAEASPNQLQLLIEAIQNDQSGRTFISVLAQLADQESLSGLDGGFFKKIGSALKSVVSKGASIVKSVVGGGASEQPQTILVQQPQQPQYAPVPQAPSPSTSNNTALYVGIAAAGVLAISAVVILSKRPQQPVQILQAQPAPQLSGADEE